MGLGNKGPSGREEMQEGVRSAPKVQGGWEGLAEPPSSPVSLQDPSSGADAQGASMKRNLKCESPFLGLLGPFPRVSGDEVERILKPLRTASSRIFMSWAHVRGYGSE